jgi:hypothetical protein
MSEQVLAQVLDARDGVGGTWSELLGRPGAMYWYAVNHRKQVDVCCPGCGQFVCRLEADKYPLGGSEMAPSCTVVIEFSGCCHWKGKLTDGVWIPES